MKRPVPVVLTGATVTFGTTVALAGVNASFDPGTVTALVGGDGAGKSTLLRVLAGRIHPTAERMEGLPSRPQDRAGVGYQPAGSGVWPNLTVAENVEFVVRVFGGASRRMRTSADDLIALAGLEPARDRVAGRLSGGMRQKLGVVMALVHDPGLVLLDEPTTGVDPISRTELWTLVAGAAAGGATVVMATTYLDEARRATRLLLLDAGRVLAQGTGDQVIAQSPGTVWQAPADQDAGRRALASPRAWRRATTVHLWTPDEHSPAPAGFTRAPRDLESASIAAILGAREERASHADAATTPPADDGALDPPSRSATTDPSTDVVHAHEITRTYGAVTALDDVSLGMRPGRILGLLGGNGAGKTTLIRILMGVETPTSGTATVLGGPPSMEARRRIGYVAQGLGLYPSLSAMENLEFVASIHGVPVTERARAFARGLGRAPVARLPLGVQRVLACVAAVVHDPDVLVLDEPTSGMDALSRARLWRDLRAWADRGTAVLVTTHDMREAAQCDQLVILTAGRVTGAGTPTSITEGRLSVHVRADRWQRAFELLRDAGLPVLLDGVDLRVPRDPGSTAQEVADALEPLGGRVALVDEPATLAETILLDARAAAAQTDPEPARER